MSVLVSFLFDVILSFQAFPLPCPSDNSIAFWETASMFTLSLCPSYWTVSSSLPRNTKDMLFWAFRGQISATVDLPEVHLCVWTPSLIYLPRTNLWATNRRNQRLGKNFCKGLLERLISSPRFSLPVSFMSASCLCFSHLESRRRRWNTGVAMPSDATLPLENNHSLGEAGMDNSLVHAYSIHDCCKVTWIQTELEFFSGVPQWKNPACNLDKPFTT